MNIGDGRNLFSWEMVYMPSYRAYASAAAAAVVAVVVVASFFLVLLLARFILCKTITAMLMVDEAGSKMFEHVMLYISFGDFCWIRKMGISVVLALAGCWKLLKLFFLFWFILFLFRTMLLLCFFFVLDLILFCLVGLVAGVACFLSILAIIVCIHFVNDC